MTSKSELTRISKFLSLVLRHEPQKIGITLDSAGWVKIDELLARSAANGMSLTREQLEEVVATSDKQRFAFNEDRSQIRANQGHSVEVELGHAPAIPPAELYHGTADRNLESIRQQGLLKGQRHHVHLSPTPEIAHQVGQRHGKPVVLTVHAGKMATDGFAFYLTPNKVWLVDTVPPKYLSIGDGPLI